MNALKKTLVATLGSVFFATSTVSYAMTTASYPIETVGPFDTYDLSSASVALLNESKAATNPGDTYAGYYQGHVNEHVLGSTAITSTLLNSSYEITAVARFTGETISFDGVNSLFSISSAGGPDADFKLLFDAANNRDLVADSGYTDTTLGESLLEGTIVGGTGSLTLLGGGIVDGLGFTTLEIAVTKTAANIFDPDILSAGALLRLTLDEDGALTSPITSVLGELVDSPNDLLVGVDAELRLAAVPLPAAFWLFGGALGLLGIYARRRN